MREQWVMPRVEIERFAANDAVSVCIEGKLQCVVYPGTQWAKGDNGAYDDYTDDNDSAGYWYEDNPSSSGIQTGRYPHGRCGLDQVVTFNSDTAVAHESNGALDYNISVPNTALKDLTPGTYYGVTWNSDYYHTLSSGKLNIA